MQFVDLLPAIAPAGTVAAAWYALRPSAPAVAPLRLSLVRAALVVGVSAIVGVELLSAAGWLTRVGIGAFWAVGLAVALGAAWYRHRTTPRSAPGGHADPALGTDAGAGADAAAGTRVPAGVLVRAGGSGVDGGSARPGVDGAPGPDEAAWAGEATWPFETPWATEATRPLVTPYAPGAADRRAGRAPGTGGPAARFARLRPVEWLMIVVLAAIALGTLVIAVFAPPNTWDSAAYHLPKVEEWVARHSVAPFPTGYSLQVALAPGAEYLLLHLRLLTGGDWLYNLVQWSTGVIGIVAATRVAAQLGASRLGQLATATVAATTPIAVLEASSTQTDLVAAGWCACAATVVVDSLSGGRRRADVALLGGAVGLAMVTKSTGMATVGILAVLWFVGQAVRARSAGAVRGLAVATLAVGAIALVVTGPFLVRTTVTYGNPLGPVDVRKHAVAKHDPIAITVNAARLAQTATMVPDDEINHMTARAVARLADLLGADLQDPDTTRDLPFPLRAYPGPDEDYAVFPLQFAALVAGFGFCLVAFRRDPRILGYTLACLGIALGFAATLRWQPFSNRLLLPGVLVAAPLAGLAADAVAAAGRRLPARTAGASVLTAVVLVAAVAGGDAVLHGNPRPLVGPASVLTTDRMQQRFARTPAYLGDYTWAAAIVRRSGAARVGLVDGMSHIEYPWWVLLPDQRIVELVSITPGHPGPAPTSVDAIICSPPIPDTCAARIPAGWQVRQRETVLVALPPGNQP